MLKRRQSRLNLETNLIPKTRTELDVKSGNTRRPPAGLSFALKKRSRIRRVLGLGSVGDR